MVNIDTWEAGCKVIAFDWTDGKSIYLHMEYYKPGQSLSEKPANEKSFLLEKSERTEYYLNNYLNSIVANLMWTRSAVYS